MLAVINSGILFSIIFPAESFVKRINPKGIITRKVIAFSFDKRARKKNIPLNASGKIFFIFLSEGILFSLVFGFFLSGSALPARGSKRKKEKMTKNKAKISSRLFMFATTSE